MTHQFVLRPAGRRRRRWNDNLNTYHRKINCEGFGGRLFGTVSSVCYLIRLSLASKFYIISDVNSKFLVKF